MDYLVNNNNIIIKNQTDFDIKQILKCGQSFRFKEISENKFEIIAFGKVITVSSLNETVEIEGTTEDDFLNIWVDYFDLKTDYSQIKSVLSKNDDIMKKCVKYGNGIRILRQDPFEIIITFIISQNNRIPMIKKVVENIAEKYGKKIDDKHFAFPTFDELKNATTYDLNELKTGFRSKYIRDFLDKLENGTLNLEELKFLDENALKNELLKVKGIGNKVADCILLFGYGKTNAFPVDVWIKRVVEYFYFENMDTKKEIIEKFGRDNFGEYGGYAQQYLFYYAREEQIGK